jgi:hypothetical protein
MFRVLLSIFGARQVKNPVNSGLISEIIKILVQLSNCRFSEDNATVFAKLGYDSVAIKIPACRCPGLPSPDEPVFISTL